MLGSILSNILLVLGMSFFVGKILEVSVSQFVLNLPRRSLQAGEPFPTNGGPEVSTQFSLLHTQ
jgi:hypothetical protein